MRQKILEAYQENNNLTELRINNADLQNGGDEVIVTTLRRCTNLKHIYLYCCDIPDQQLLPVIEAIRGHASLEMLDLSGNNIGSAGCGTIATLLEDPNCNIHTLDLRDNNINNEGATILATGLANNTRLRELWLYNNPIDRSVVGIFSKLLCNMSSINSIYSSNHTLQYLDGVRFTACTVTKDEWKGYQQKSCCNQKDSAISSRN